MAALVDDAVGGDIDDLDEFSACKFDAPPRYEVLRVAGDPQGVDVEFANQREQKANGAGGIMMSTVSGVDRVTDMSCIAFYVGC